MCVERFNSENPVEFQWEIAFIIFHPQSCEVLLDTAPVSPQIPRIAVSSRQIEWQELQERLKAITQRELRDFALTCKMDEGGTKYFFIDGSAIVGKEGYTWNSVWQSREAFKDVDIKVYSRLLECLGFSWGNAWA